MKLVDIIDTIDEPALFTYWTINHFIFTSLLFLVIYLVLSLAKNNNLNLLVVITLVYIISGYYTFDSTEIDTSLYITQMITLSVTSWIIYRRIPEGKNKIQLFSLIVTLIIHTYYEYYTAGDKAKDKWWKEKGFPSSSSSLSNSVINSIGDTIGALLGCLFVWYLIDNLNCNFEICGISLFYNKIIIISYLIFSLIILSYYFEKFLNKYLPRTVG